MDWEGGNGHSHSSSAEEQQEDEETREKLTKWRIQDKVFSTAAPTIINSNSNSNPTDLSLSSHSQHLLRGSTITNYNHHQFQYLHHHPTSNTNNTGIFGISSSNSNSSTNNHNNANANVNLTKLAHIYVSTATSSGAFSLSSSATSSGSSSGVSSPSCASLDLTTTVKIEPGSVIVTSANDTNTNSGSVKNGNGSSKKSKPIPPPLDLSIGAANLSLNSPSLVTPTPTSLLQPHLLCYNNNFCSSGGSITNSPFYWASSPKFNQAEKTLPLRKRWHSWSPIQMNRSDDPMLPLYTDTHLMSIKQERGTGNNVDNHGHGLQNGCGNQNGYSNSRSNHPPANCNGGNNQQQHGSGSSIFNQSTGLQTPTPFYTPNEPSPKFMNSPVFSYSTPDTSLYQGPFSPIRSSTLYPPPSSPYMNSSSSLNTPTFTMTPNVLSTTTMAMSAGNNNNNLCFNMVPSTLLSPAPSQASTNSLSYEDLHEKSSPSSSASLNLFTPIWNIFMSGTKIRFVGGMNSMDWYFVDFLAQSGESLGLKEDYAPNGLQVRTLVVPCSIKERIQITFCPIADPHHPPIEVNCESGHPFMVEKKGWCSVKPDAFFETYGTHCQTLEGGDVCLSLAATSLTAKSPQQNHQHQQDQQPQQQNHNFNVQVCMMDQGSTTNGMCVNMTNGISPSNSISILPTVEEKPVPISVIPQHQPQHIIQLCNPPMTHKKLSGGTNTTSCIGSGGKRSNKESTHGHGHAEPKGRRPMNAFLLFAKDKRPELIQQYPGKDNRSISVLLGEAWQGLAPLEKEKYAANARLRAEEQKRMHPDCWKRKRSQSQSAV